MKRKFNQIYQFKVTLKGIQPPIWRRIQVPETYSFWDLHIAIQDAMGWLDYHLHSFKVLNPSTALKDEIGIPAEDFGHDTEISAGWEKKISQYFSPDNAKADYTYDFGDNWKHTIKLEKILPRDMKIKYPVCIKGERACPPEDCGGIWGYQDFLEAIMNPQHSDHQQMLEWVGGGFESEHFDSKAVRFDDPQKRWKRAFGRD